MHTATAWAPSSVKIEWFFAFMAGQDDIQIPVDRCALMLTSQF